MHQSPSARRTNRASLDRLEARRMLAAHIANNPTVYATIQSAIDAATAGTTINVDAGTYGELVTIDKPLTLRGAKAGVDGRDKSRGTGETIVNGEALSAGRSTAFRITANDVTLDGFTVQDNSSSNQYGAGIVIDPNVAGTKILDNVVQHNVTGLYLASSSDNDQTVIRHNVFAFNNNAGNNSGRGIYSDGGVSGGKLTNVLIEENTFTANTGDNLFEAAVGLEAQTAGKQANVTIRNNIMNANGKGVLLINAANIDFVGNTVTGSTDTGSAAVRIEGGSSGIRIADNLIQNNTGAAVRIDDRFTGANSNITITHNDFVNNAGGGVLVSESGYTGTLDATNNFWGNATGPSGDASGTGAALIANGVSVIYSPFSKTSIASAAKPATPTPPTAPTPPATPPKPHKTRAQILRDLRKAIAEAARRLADLQSKWIKSLRHLLLSRLPKLAKQVKVAMKAKREVEFSYVNLFRR